MPDAPEVKIKLTAEDQGVAAAIKNLTAQLQSIKDKEAEVADTTLDLTEAFSGLIAVLGVEKLAEFGSEVFDAGVKIARLSQVTGVSSETLSVYSQAAKDAGGNAGEMQGGIQKLSTVLTLADQGSQRAAKALALVGLSSKDFVGLNADQKIKKVFDAIASLPPGLQKTAAAQKLLGDASGELLAAVDNLAGDGFDHAKEEAEKFGNLLSGDTARDLIVTQEAIKRLEAEAEGAALQFEAGFIPALTDVANAIVAATEGKGGGGFKTLGEVGGAVFKKLTEVAIAFTDTIVRNFALASSDVQNFGRFLAEAYSKGFSQANKDLATNIKNDYAAINKEIDDRESAALAELDGKSRAAAENAARIADQANKGKKAPGLVNPEAAKAAIKAQQLEDQIYQAQLAAAIKQLQAETEINKAKNDAIGAQDKAQFDEGLITLDEYFARRRAAIQNDNDVALKNLQAQKEAELYAGQRADDEARANLKQQQSHGADSPAGQEFGTAAEKNVQEEQRALAALAEIETKMQLLQASGQQKLATEDLAAFKAREEQATKLAGFEKELQDIQGNTTAAAKAEAAAKEQEYRTLLTSQKGATSSSVDAQIAKYHELTTAAAQFNDTRKAGEDELKSLQADKAGVEQKVESGQLFQIQGAKQIRDLDAQHLAALKAIAAAQLAAANVTGNKADIQAAQDFKTQVAQIAVESNLATQELATIKQGIETTFASSLESFFTTGIKGSRDVAQAFAGLADSIVSSLSKMAAQILINIAMQKILNSLSSGSGGGGGLGAIGGLPTAILGFAGGGLVRGPGSGTSDSISARLSTGEFVFKAAAVKAIGVGTLAAMNAGLHIGAHAQVSPAPVHFAEGGLVGGTGGSASPALVHLQLGIEEGIVLKHMKSPAAGKVVISHIANNPKGASKAIGRS
jgi:hypothetical protein